jgi:hypothetical protein
MDEEQSVCWLFTARVALQTWGTSKSVARVFRDPRMQKARTHKNLKAHASSKLHTTCCGDELAQTLTMKVAGAQNLMHSAGLASV